MLTRAKNCNIWLQSSTCIIQLLWPTLLIWKLKHLILDRWIINNIRFFFSQFDLISSKDLEMSVFLHYFHEIFFLSNYHCVLYTTAIELLFARIRGHCALYWRPFSASLQRPRDFQSFPSMSKKNTQTSNHKFLLW